MKVDKAKKCLIVEDGEEVTHHFEVAAWWEHIRLQGGEYPFVLKNRMYVAEVPGRTIQRFMPSLFGGVMYGSKGIEDVDEPTVHYVCRFHYELEEKT